ncbi:histidine phosphatase superfamily [Blastocladiella britannica]|nr:histidine phosphatase superfamily [Blastocladiella britannica]
MTDYDKRRAPNPQHIATTAAAPPPLSPADLAARYPSNLVLRLVQFVHRHAERTPVSPWIQHLVQPVHNDCLVGSFLELQSTVGGAAGARQTYRKALFNAATWDEDVPSHHVHAAPSLSTCYHGQLTDRGRSTMAGIGASLRDLYVTKLKFLPANLSHPSLVYLRSTDYPRTLESLHSLFDGLFPPATRSGAVAASDPLIIYSRSPVGYDNSYADYECARYRALRKQFDAIVHPQLANEYKTWSPKLQSLLHSKHGAVAAFDVLVSSLAHNWDVDITPDEFETLRTASTRQWFDYISMYPEFPKLMIGRFVTEIHELQQHVVDTPPMAAAAAPSIGAVSPSPPRPSPLPATEFSMHVQHMADFKADVPPKMAVYAGHDTTIVPLLAALDLWQGENKQWPYFASHIAFETFQDTTVVKADPTNRDPAASHYVRVLYNDEPQHLPACADKIAHHPSGDTSLCTFAAFRALVAEVGETRKQHIENCKIKKWD